MKTLLALSLLLPLSAFANKTTTLTCDGHELVKGNQGKNATVVITATTDDRQHTSDGIQLLSGLTVTWDGAVMMGPGVSCGAELAAEANECYTRLYNTTDGLAYNFRQDCGLGAFDTRGIPHRAAEASVVLNSRADHGRFSCLAHDAKKYAYIELSNCR